MAECTYYAGMTLSVMLIATTIYFLVRYYKKMNTYRMDLLTWCHATKPVFPKATVSLSGIVVVIMIIANVRLYQGKVMLMACNRDNLKQQRVSCR